LSRVAVHEAGLIQVPANAGGAEVDRYRRSVAIALLGQNEYDNRRLQYRPQENQGGSEPCLP
jgi:hypothetical protein